MMVHFTETGYTVIATISGRHGQYGSTTSMIGIFNKLKTAEEQRTKFIKAYNDAFSKGLPYRITDAHVQIVPIKMNKVNEQVLSKIYE